MTRNDSEGVAMLVAGCFVISCAIGLVLGLWVGHTEACASIKTEWRDNKCVRVVVEDVK